MIRESCFSEEFEGIEVANFRTERKNFDKYLCGKYNKKPEVEHQLKMIFKAKKKFIPKRCYGGNIEISRLLPK
jgi:hypothetical protein